MMEGEGGGRGLNERGQGVGVKGGIGVVDGGWG
jgi:hypothetical protein